MESAKEMRATAWLRCALTVLLIPAAGLLAATEGTQQEPGVPGMETHRIEDPVFKGRIAVYEAGRGNPRAILLVHGIGPDGARDFGDHITWLRESFHVIAVDLPGFGQSDQANVLYSPANYVGVVKHVADRYLGRPFVLVGHSMGALVSLRYAADFPGDVERLVVVSAPGILHRYVAGSRMLANLGLGYMPGGAGSLDSLGRFAGRILTPLERLRVDPQTVLASPQLRGTLLGGDPARIAGLAAVADDVHRKLPDVRAETLVVWGARDTIAPPRTGRLLALKLPRARLVMVEKAAHVPMQENPDGFRAALESFLERGLPPAVDGTAVTSRHGEVYCRRERQREYTGEFDRLTLDGCQQARIRDARVRELRVIGSTVTIDDSHLGGGKTGMIARGSTIVMTGGRIEGEVAIAAHGSRLDLAGVEVEGREAAITASRRSYVVLSLSRLRSPYTQGEVHDFYTLNEHDRR